MPNEVKRIITLRKFGNGVGVSLSNYRDQGVSKTENCSSLYEHIVEYEKKLILKALQENNWIKTETAKALKIPYTSFRLKLKQLAIE